MRRPLFYVVALCTAFSLFLIPAPSRADSDPGITMVVVNSTTATTLSNMGLGFSALGPASFNSSSLTFNFPITNGTIGAQGDVFSHDGSGFALANGSADITFRNLVIDTATQTLSGNVHFGNTQANGVTLFDITSGGVLTLDAQAAADLSAAFGIANLTGTNIGTASVLLSVPLGGDSPAGPVGTPAGPTRSTPEPSTLGLLGIAAAGIGLLSLLRVSKRQVALA